MVSSTNLLPAVPAAAAGLLLCHELPLQTDDRVTSLSLSYQHTLATLIREVSANELQSHALHVLVVTGVKEHVCLTGVKVNIEPCEWHHAIHLPKAWQNFMSRAFHAVLQVCSPVPSISCTALVCLCVSIGDISLHSCVFRLHCCFDLACIHVGNFDLIWVLKQNRDFFFWQC